MNPDPDPCPLRAAISKALNRLPLTPEDERLLAAHADANDAMRPLFEDLLHALGRLVLLLRKTARFTRSEQGLALYGRAQRPNAELMRSLEVLLSGLVTSELESIAPYSMGDDPDGGDPAGDDPEPAHPPPWLLKAWRPDDRRGQSRA